MREQKYKARKTVIDGIEFASKLEAERYIQLKMMSRSDPPMISDLILQPEFQISNGFLDPKTKEKVRSRFYVADFQYVDLLEHKVIVEDTKGMETDTFRLKWDLVRARYRGYEFRLLKRSEV